MVVIALDGAAARRTGAARIARAGAQTAVRAEARTKELAAATAKAYMATGLGEDGETTVESGWSEGDREGLSAGRSGSISCET